MITMPKMSMRSALIASLLSAGVLSLGAQTPPPAGQAPPTPQQPDTISTVVTSEPGAPPRFAVPDFIALTSDAETQAIARTMGEVLWDDLAFEREFYMIPRDTYATIPAARSFETVPFDRWRELGADGLVIGTVRKSGTSITVQVRVFDIRSGRSVFGKEYTGSGANPRLYSHMISDEIHKQQRGLDGVARTKLTFTSDRDGERVAGPVDDRSIKEVYIADYDGANQRRVTVNRSLNINPVWSADGRAIAYTSYRRRFPDIFVSFIYQGTLETPAGGGAAVHNFTPSWSPDGTRLAFASSREGNMELYVMNVDGSGLRRITNHPAADITPAWSPAGNQIAFTSDRSGTPQIYVVDADGLNLRRLTYESYADRATWGLMNELAFAARTGPGYDIKILDLASREVRQVTDGRGSNESPTFSPNGRHIAFSSTRLGRRHVFTIGRDGRGLRQITRDGNNFTPDWSR